MRAMRHNGFAVLALLLALAARAEEPAPENSAQAGPPADAEEVTGTSARTHHEVCDDPGGDGRAVIDRMQKGVYAGVCGTALWFDSLFGTPRREQDSEDTFGRLGLFETYDRRDRLETRLRLRARIALPALENRARLTLGRGDGQDLVGEPTANSRVQLPSAFQGVNNDEWLLGLGYSPRDRMANGFDFGIGVRLRFPVDPYVKVTYRHNWVFSDDTLLRFRETPFWRDSRGFGATTQVSLDHLLSPSRLLRWSNAATLAEDTEGFDWGTSVTAFQSLSRRRAISFSTLLLGETRADVRIQDFGFETRYRQRVLREWLFMELSASATWPREFLEEKREFNPGVGIGFEMYFGPVPEGQMY